MTEIISITANKGRVLIWTADIEKEKHLIEEVETGKDGEKTHVLNTWEEAEELYTTLVNTLIN